MTWLKPLRGSIWLGLGYLLSPLSWWNDLVFNLPIAYSLGWLVNWVHPGWLLPATVGGYWLSNVLGLVMMQWGVTDIVLTQSESTWRRDLLISLGSSTIYTLIVVGLLYFQVLPWPEFLML